MRTSAVDDRRYADRCMSAIPEHGSCRTGHPSHLRFRQKTAAPVRRSRRPAGFPTPVAGFRAMLRRARRMSHPCVSQPAAGRCVHPHIDALHQVPRHVDVVVFDEDEPTGKPAIARELDDLLNQLFAPVVAWMCLAGEHELHGRPWIATEARQAVEVGEQQRCPLVGREASRESNRQRDSTSTTGSVRVLPAWLCALPRRLPCMFRPRRNEAPPETSRQADLRY